MSGIVEFDILMTFVEGVAEHDCEYGDGCPLFPEVALNHYRCQPCKAREAIEEVLKTASQLSDGEGITADENLGKREENRKGKNGE